MKGPEFNNGFVTALALFYAHRDQEFFTKKAEDPDLRIYSASDHLAGIEYPKNLPKALRKEIESFVSAAWELRLKHIKKVQGDALFQRCQNLLKKIDKQVFGLRVIVHYA